MNAVIDTAVRNEEGPGNGADLYIFVARWKSQAKEASECEGVTGMAGNKTIMSAGTGFAEVDVGSKGGFMGWSRALDDIFNQIRR